MGQNCTSEINFLCQKLLTGCFFSLQDINFERPTFFLVFSHLQFLDISFSKIMPNFCQLSLFTKYINFLGVCTFFAKNQTIFDPPN